MIFEKLPGGLGAGNKGLVFYIIETFDCFFHGNGINLCVEKADPCLANTKPSKAEVEKCLELIFPSLEAD